MFDLSIVVPTCNRAASLAKCLESIRSSVHCCYEIIVVDGASSDDTSRVLQTAWKQMGGSLRVIEESRREGFVRAVNKGFRAAQGQYLTWLNDDARPIERSLDRAVDQLAFAPRNIGMVALFTPASSERNVAMEMRHQGRSFHLQHVRGTLYANFGVAARATFEHLNYFDERYFLNGADPDFSLKVWDAGMKVAPALGAMIDHDELPDERRSDDRGRGEQDNAALFAKWNLPDRNSRESEFDQTHPCTLRGLRAARAA
jgi:GT2 family glycosyltransferase